MELGRKEDFYGGYWASLGGNLTLAFGEGTWVAFG